MSELSTHVWSELSPYLDQMLGLEPQRRESWLESLGRSEPTIATRLRTYLAELGEMDRQHFLSRAARVSLALEGVAGQCFGAYTLDLEVGRGGMGAVWLAHRSDGCFEGRAAVKLLNAECLGHPCGRHVLREGSVLAKLQHPNIAHLLNAGVSSNGQPYLILEHVRGAWIDCYCDTHELSVERRVRLFLDVLAAVAHAHGNLIVHRDLKREGFAAISMTSS